MSAQKGPGAFFLVRTAMKRFCLSAEFADMMQKQYSYGTRDADKDVRVEWYKKWPVCWSQRDSKDKWPVCGACWRERFTQDLDKKQLLKWWATPKVQEYFLQEMIDEEARDVREARRNSWDLPPYPSEAAGSSTDSSAGSSTDSSAIPSEGAGSSALPSEGAGSSALPSSDGAGSSALPKALPKRNKVTLLPGATSKAAGSKPKVSVPKASGDAGSSAHQKTACNEKIPSRKEIIKRICDAIVVADSIPELDRLQGILKTALNTGVLPDDFVFTTTSASSSSSSASSAPPPVSSTVAEVPPPVPPPVSSSAAEAPPPAPPPASSSSAEAPPRFWPGKVREGRVCAPGQVDLAGLSAHPVPPPPMPADSTAFRRLPPEAITPPRELTQAAKRQKKRR